MMTSNTLTILSRLSVGDQFTRCDRADQIVYTVLETPRKIKGVRYCRKGENMMPDMLPVKTEVVFLKRVK